MWNIDAPDIHHPNVLVVSADEETRGRVADALARVAGSIELARRARYALSRVSDGDFDAAVIDLSTPQGWALLHFLGESGTPVVALSRSTDDHTVRVARSMGAAVVLPRLLPVAAMLQVALMRALRQHTPRRHLVAV